MPRSQGVAWGDGANDLEMLATAGLGIAFNAKPVVKEQADTAISVPYLDAILFTMGIRRQDVEEADEPDPLAGDIWDGDPVGLHHPLGNRCVQAPGHRVFTHPTPVGGEEGPHLVD